VEPRVDIRLLEVPKVVVAGFEAYLLDNIGLFSNWTRVLPEIHHSLPHEVLEDGLHEFNGLLVFHVCQLEVSEIDQHVGLLFFNVGLIFD